MKYVFRPLQLQAEWKWLSEKAQCNYCEDTKGIIAYKGLEIVAGVSLDSWSYNSTTIHVAIDDIWVLRHGFIEEILSYVFEKCKRNIIIGVTPADNLKALKFNSHIGFEELYRIKDGYKVGIDYVVQQLRKEDCRYGQKIHSCAA